MGRLVVWLCLALGFTAACVIKTSAFKIQLPNEFLNTCMYGLLRVESACFLVALVRSSSVGLHLVHF